ncbi:MAG TPA: hypothetical protein VK176_03535 [Phycisphaerales bacterium]|nr:hypothetical protein [Phycisphaerales bacterium]
MATPPLRGCTHTSTKHRASPPLIRCAFASLMACASLVLPGCSYFSGEGPLTTQSVDADFDLLLEPGIRAYRSTDPNTADIYLTDLPRELCQPGASLGEASGQLLHIHLFISPEAGETPIESTACSVSIRLVVISRGQVGVYGGGGFLYPDSDLGDEDFEGSIRRGTLKYMNGTPGFADRLGPSELSGDIEAPKDEAAVRILAARLDELLGMTRKPAP